MERSAVTSHPTGQLLLPPPGLLLPGLVLTHFSPSGDGCSSEHNIDHSSKPGETDPDEEQFSGLLRSRRLPATLDNNQHRYQRLQSAVLGCIESLYRDRIAPQLGEVHRRLRQNIGNHGDGWLPSEFHAVLAICARQPSTYRLVPCCNGKQPMILLRSPPRWFRGWINSDEDSSIYPPRVWNDLGQLLQGAAGSCLATGGGVRQVATNLHRQGILLPASLKHLSLGELEHVVKLALHCDREVLVYDTDNGSRLRTGAAPVEEECVGKLVATMPMFNLDMQFGDLEFEQAAACEVAALAADQDVEVWQQSWINPGVTFHWI